MKLTTLMKGTTLGAAALMMAACTSGYDNNRPQNDRYYPGSESYYQTTKINDYQRISSPFSAIPTGSDLQYLKLTHLMTPQDKVCVLNSGDFSNGQIVVRNSGTYVQRSIGDNLDQHGTGVVLLSGTDVSYLQETARDRGCNIIAATQLLNWQTNSRNYPLVSILLNMYDVSSLTLMNSVRLVATAESAALLYDDAKGVIKPLIATYIHKLYQN